MVFFPVRLAARIMRIQESARPIRHLLRMMSVCSSALVLSAALFSSAAQAQGSPRNTLGPTVQIHVDDVNGRPFYGQAEVSLAANGGNGEFKSETHGAGTATFRNVTPADYSLEVTAEGYETARDRVLVNGGNSYINLHVTLRESNDPTGAKHAPQAPVLAGRSKKELDQAVAALRKGKIEDAMHHLEYPLEHANGDPTVQYVAGVCAEGTKDYTAARQHFETAVSVFPEYFNAQLDLGTLLLEQLSDAPDAIPHLNEALTLDPNSWRGHWLIAQAFLATGGAAANAEAHAKRALELGKEKSVGAAVTLAYAMAKGGNTAEARTILEKFIHDHPQDPMVTQARQLLRSNMLRATPASPTAAIH
jgi:Flp pilus assembly protein TadD